MPDTLLADPETDLKVHDAFTGPSGTAPFEGVIGVEGLLTGDGRLIEEQSLEWATFPLPLRYAPADFGGHDGAVIVGRIDRVERRDNGDIYAWGVLDLGSKDGRECARLMRGQFLSGVSMDLDSVDAFDAEVRMYGADGEESVAPNVLVTHEARVRAATLVAIPAFDEARLALIASRGANFRIGVGHGAFSTTFASEDEEFEAIRAGYTAERERDAKQVEVLAAAFKFSPKARALAAMRSKVETLTGHKVGTFAYNPDQWRDPSNGKWIDMPSIALGKWLDGSSSEDGGSSTPGQSLSPGTRDLLTDQAAKIDKALQANDVDKAQTSASDLQNTLDALEKGGDVTTPADLTATLDEIQNADSFETGDSSTVDEGAPEGSDFDNPDEGPSSGAIDLEDTSDLEGISSTAPEDSGASDTSDGASPDNPVAYTHKGDDGPDPDEGDRVTDGDGNTGTVTGVNAGQVSYETDVANGSKSMKQHYTKLQKIGTTGDGVSDQATPAEGEPVPYSDKGKPGPDPQVGDTVVDDKGRTGTVTAVSGGDVSYEGDDGTPYKQHYSKLQKTGSDNASEDSGADSDAEDSGAPDGPPLDPEAPGTDENGIPYKDLDQASTQLHAHAEKQGRLSPLGNNTAQTQLYKDKRQAGKSHKTALNETKAEAFPPGPKTNSDGSIATTPKSLKEAGAADPTNFKSGFDGARTQLGGPPKGWAIEPNADPPQYYLLRPVGDHGSKGDFGHFDSPEEAMAAQSGYEQGAQAWDEVNAQFKAGKIDLATATDPTKFQALWDDIGANVQGGMSPKQAVSAAVKSAKSPSGGVPVPQDNPSGADLSDVSDAVLLQRLRGLIMNGGKASDISALEAEAANRGLSINGSAPVAKAAGETEVLAGSESFRGDDAVAEEDCGCDELSEQGVVGFGTEWKNPVTGESMPLPGLALQSLIMTLANGGLEVSATAISSATEFAETLDAALASGDWNTVFTTAPSFYEATGALYQDYLNEATGSEVYAEASTAYETLENSVLVAASAADESFTLELDADSGDSGDSGEDSSEGGMEGINVKVNPTDTGDDMLDEAILDAVESGSTVVIIADDPSAGPFDAVVGDSGEDSGDSGLPDLVMDGLDAIDSGAIDVGSDSGTDALTSTPEGGLLTGLVAMLGSGDPVSGFDPTDLETLEALGGEIISAAYSGDMATVAAAAPVLLAQLGTLCQVYAGVPDIASALDLFKTAIISLITSGPTDSGDDGDGDGDSPDDSGDDEGDDGYAIAQNPARAKPETGYASATEAFKSASHKNWVQETGGLPHYIKKIAQHLQAQGMDESHAIAAAVSTVKRWSRGGNGVKADTVAKSLAALAEWEAKKAASHVNANADEVVFATVGAAEAYFRAKSAASRKKGASSGAAMPDGSFPIDDVVDLKAAIKAQGRAKNPAAAKKHIKSRAKSLGKESLIPDGWAAELEAFDLEAWEAELAGDIAVSARPTDITSLVASGGQTLAPVAPPKDWFANPKLTGVTPFTVTPEGRVYGHLATWQSCHMESKELGQTCVRAPKSHNGYAGFHTGYVTTEEGVDVPTGRLVAGAPHADPIWGLNSTLVHYSHSGWVGADVRVGEDAYGIWVAGALRPDISANQLRALKASPLSGDWREDPNTGRLELVMGLAVNAPGFGVPRVQALVASAGNVTSMQAVGLVAPRTVVKPGTKGALSIEDLLYLKERAAETKSWGGEAEKLMTLAKDSRSSHIREFVQRRNMEALAARVKELR
jgi:hypothetical protein